MKTALILLASGFEETEAVTIIDVLRRGKVAVTSASLGDQLVKGAHGIQVMADTALSEVAERLFDVVILPGGMGGTENLLASEAVGMLLKRHAEQGRIVSAICAAPLVLEKAGLLVGKTATIYPGLDDKLCSAAQVSGASVVEDAKIITSRGPGTAMEFALLLVARLEGKAKADQVAAGLLYSKQ
ncbi:MAG: DJ-1/PfpI family protein [Proteobacteria bacterium]|nr:DJ-1/PfpI family protein [Pseudomonadota bacterium]MBU1640813.1 DJ-1/PfpI family protein [Pseudomonadota bacterium]